MKVGECANKERRPQHQQQRKSDLGDNQELAQTDAPSTPARGAGASFFEAGVISTRVASMAGARPKRIPVANATVSVKARMRQSSSARRLKSVTATGKQPDQEANSDGRNAETEDAARQREQQAFRQQLPQAREGGWRPD